MKETKKNAYVCQQFGHLTVTVDRDEGVTPFMIGCETKGCTGDAFSTFYKPPLSAGEPTHEWYRPSPDACATLDEATVYHVQQGGLLLRKIVR